jgi:NADP-dependent 3-hydroxy acid dehydrogenase YdfG
MIDVTFDVDAVKLVQQLRTELLSRPTDDMVALRGPHRWVQRWEPIRMDAAAPTRLRQGGVYVITGGLGGIALALADHLVTAWQAKLVLLARTLHPAKLNQVRALEAKGADILVVGADVANAAEVRDALEKAEARFGVVNGVFHAAGAPGVGMMQWKTREAVGRVFAPKIHGTLALADALADRALDFFVLFSSVTSATGGGPGQADYCGANAFLDAWARQAPAHYNAVAVSWGEWQWDAWSDGLAGFPEDVRAFLIANRKAYGLTFAEGSEALTRVLARDLTHVFVVTQDLETMVAGGRRSSAAASLAQLEERARPVYPRPALSSSFREPQPGLESQIAVLWRELLGVDRVGGDDNFFELGGNSLLGIGLIAQLRKQLRLDRLPPQVLYEAPTVAALAEYIQPNREPGALPDMEGDNRKRIDRLRALRRRAQEEPA